MSDISIANSNFAALCNRTTQQVNRMGSLSIGAAIAAVLLSTAWAAAAASPPGRMQAKFDRVERKTNGNHTSLPRHGEVPTTGSAKKPASQIDNDGDKYPPTDLFSGMNRF